MRHTFFLVLAVAASTPVAFGADFFIKASAKFTGGPEKELLCERNAGQSKKEMFDTNMPVAGNKIRTYNFSCSSGKDFFGFSLRFQSSEDPSKVTFKVYNEDKKTGVVYGDQKKPSVTFKAAVGAKVMQVHSFKGEQHFLPEATSFKVTEFKEEKEGIKFYHVLAGEGVAKFEDKQLATSVGYAGELTFSFRVRPEYRKSPI